MTLLTRKLSQGDPRLGQQDTVIRPYVTMPESLAEIDRLRARVLPTLEWVRGR